MATSTLLRSARTSQGVTQRALAASSGVHQPRIAALESATEDATVSRLEALLRQLDTQLTLIPSNLRPVWAAGADVRRALHREDYRTAWREIIQLNDDLRAADSATCVALAIAAPEPTGDHRFDALLAAVTDACLCGRRLPRPAWLDDDSRRLSEPWDVEDVPELQKAARQATPKSIRRHGIYLDPSVLASV